MAPPTVEALANTSSETREVTILPYGEQVRILHHGSLTERRKLASQHVLKLLLGRDYDKVMKRAFFGTLKRKAAEGEIDLVTLEAARKGVATYETIERDRVTGSYLYGRAMLVRAKHYINSIDSTQLAETIFHIFNDENWIIYL